MSKFGFMAGETIVVPSDDGVIRLSQILSCTPPNAPEIPIYYDIADSCHKLGLPLVLDMVHRIKIPVNNKATSDLHVASLQKHCGQKLDLPIYLILHNVEIPVVEFEFQYSPKINELWVDLRTEKKKKRRA